MYSDSVVTKQIYDCYSVILVKFSFEPASRCCFL